MTFLDPKENVISIVLTNYGRFLLSKGKFNPVYYEFFDQDILYDGNFASFNIKQPEIAAAVKEVPRIFPQHSFTRY